VQARHLYWLLLRDQVGPLLRAEGFRGSDQPGAQRYERTDQGPSGRAATWYTVFPGGCVTAQLDWTSAADPRGRHRGAIHPCLHHPPGAPAGAGAALERTAPPRPCKHGMI
jgi:hypothetical protein